MKFDYKKILPHLVAIAVFYAVTILYFAPIFFENKDLVQGDVTSYIGWGEDARSHYNQTGETVYWSNAMFSGMPSNYAFSPKSNSVFGYFRRLFTGFLPYNTAGPFFAYMLGFYILMLVLGCGPWLSIIGAIAYALCSYNIIIIDAGHVSKAFVMATFAPIIAGVILCYRKHYIKGALIALFATGMNVYWNHQQISYYLILTLACLAIAYFVKAIIDKELKHYFIASAILVSVAILATAPAIDKLLPTYDFSKETMRGGAVLENEEGKKSGLDIDYAYQWSYGKAETMTLLIPNFQGGSSHYNIGNESNTYNSLRQTGQGAQFCRQAPMYWGDQPFTSGPVYGGAILYFLFLLGMIIVKGAERWWILAAVIIGTILSWGSNFMPFNEWMFNYLPLYNKFRTPAMSLIINNVLMTALGVMALSTIAKDENPRRFVKPLLIAGSITAVLTLFFALFGGSLFSFSAHTDAQLPAWLHSSLIADRQQLMSSDAWRSFWFIAVAILLILGYLYLSKKLKPYMLYLAVGLFIIIDMWGVDRRFVNSDSFVPQRNAKNIQPTAVDNYILQDTDPNYRVLNLTTSTFNESRTSYFHKSIGGYSPVKLRRYQDIIDRYFVGTINMNILNMLNTRYVIINTENGPRAQYNPEAFGNAWFVNDVEWVNNPNEEIAALEDSQLLHTAFIDKQWQEQFADYQAYCAENSTAEIKMVEMRSPGNILYKYSADQPRLALFSEIYYKTWRAFVDGQEVPLLRADYVLRAVPVPAGEHEIEFKCEDTLYVKCHTYSLIASILVCLVALSLIALLIYKNFFAPKCETSQL